MPRPMMIVPYYSLRYIWYRLIEEDAMRKATRKENGNVVRF